MPLTSSSSTGILTNSDLRNSEDSPTYHMSFSPLHPLMTDLPDSVVTWPLGHVGASHHRGGLTILATATERTEDTIRTARLWLIWESGGHYTRGLDSTDWTALLNGEVCKQASPFPHHIPTPQVKDTVLYTPTAVCDQAVIPILVWLSLPRGGWS